MGAVAASRDAVRSDTDTIDPIPADSATTETPDLTVEATLAMPAAMDASAPSPEALLAEAADLLGQGRPDDAAARCREAIALAPDMVAAYSMLGMAEEQRGNLIAAAGAYRRVLQLDPSRSVEREKLELLYSCGVEREHEPGPERGGAGDQHVWLNRWAPVFVIAGGAFLTLMIITGLILHVRAARIAQRTYTEKMKVAQESLDKGDYAAAVAAFEAALAVRPDDQDAKTGLDYARRKLQAAASDSQVAQTTPPLPPIVPSGGPNPFKPVPIGPTTPVEPPATAPSPGSGHAARVVRPPVVRGDVPIVGTANSGARRSNEPVPFSPLEPVEEQPPAPAATETPPPAATEPPARRGEITIWASEAPPRSTSEQPTATTAPAPPDHGQRARQLRQQGEQLRAAGQCQEAAAAYSAAIEAYRAQSQADPSTREANEAAIRACERARSLCQSAQGQ